MTEQQFFDIISKEQDKQEIYIWKKDNVFIAKWIWNLAIQTASEHGECDCEINCPSGLMMDAEIECTLNRSSILKLKINGEEV